MHDFSVYPSACLRIAIGMSQVRVQGLKINSPRNSLERIELDLYSRLFEEAATWPCVGLCSILSFVAASDARLCLVVEWLWPLCFIIVEKNVSEEHCMDKRHADKKNGTAQVSPNKHKRYYCRCRASGRVVQKDRRHFLIDLPMNSVCRQRQIGLISAIINDTQAQAEIHKLRHRQMYADAVRCTDRDVCITAPPTPQKKQNSQFTKRLFIA